MPSDHDEKVSPKLSKSKKKRLKKREKAEKSDKTQTEAERKPVKFEFFPFKGVPRNDCPAPFFGYAYAAFLLFIIILPPSFYITASKASTSSKKPETAASLDLEKDDVTIVGHLYFVGRGGERQTRLILILFCRKSPLAAQPPSGTHPNQGQLLSSNKPFPRMRI